MLPFVIFATDYNMHNLSLNFNNIPFGASTSPSSFRVTRHPATPTQLVTFTATDNIGKTSACQFSIRLLDHQPPTFQDCPPDMRVYSASRTALLRWPAPQPKDNVGVATVRPPWKTSGELFSVGKYTIEYVALDWDGNNGSCSFDIDVVSKSESWDFFVWNIKL